MSRAAIWIRYATLGIINCLSDKGLSTNKVELNEQSHGSKYVTSLRMLFRSKKSLSQNYKVSRHSILRREVRTMQYRAHKTTQRQTPRRLLMTLVAIFLP